MTGQQLVNRGNYVSAVDIVMLTVTADTESSGHVSRVTCAVVLVARWRSLN